MKLGKIYDYRNKEEAKKLIGEKVATSDYLCNIEGIESVHDPETLIKVSGCNEYPFDVRDSSGALYSYQFIREVIEEEDEPKLMTNRQLTEWLAKGNGERKLREDEPVSNALIYYEDDENLPVGEDVVIRPWDSDEWVEPTLEIYERDCKSYCRTALA